MSSAGLRPDQAELVAIARHAFVDELLPLLPPEHRLTGLMVANALGIAERMMAGVPGASQDLPGEAAVLCSQIRAGVYDDDDAGRLRTHLIERTLARLAISSPKSLAQAKARLLPGGSS